jgi:hypothetical protein
MDNLNILLISASFYPQKSPRSYRTTELAKEFVRQNHKVTVITHKVPLVHDEFEKKYSMIIKDLGKCKWKAIRIKGTGILLLIRRILFRLSVMLFEYPDIELLWMVKKALRDVSGYDLLVSVAVPYPIHWGVAAGWRRYKPVAKTWIADCGDPYMGDTTDSFRKIFYFKFIEKWFCRKADYLSIPFEGARKAYYSEFHDKIKVIPQGFELNNLKIQKYTKSHEYPVFAYAGSFIPGKRDPRNVLNFLSQSKNNFRFIIYTNQPELIIPFKSKLGARLDIREPVSREELIWLLSGMDFLINFDNNTTTQLPSKLIDYSMSGRPVLNIREDDNLLLLIEFMNGNFTGRMHLPEITTYDIKRVAQSFINLLSVS